MPTKRQKELRQREILLQQKREKHRLARQGRHYDPNRPLGHKPKINRNFRAVEPIGGRIVLEAPPKMNLSENLAETLEYFEKLRHECISGKCRTIVTDFKSLTELSPAAAVVLISELHRVYEYCGNREMKGTYPNDPNIIAILRDIGFFKFFRIPCPKVDKNTIRSYFKIVPGNVSRGKIADQLIKTFEREQPFELAARRRLYDALIECMDNVHAHAYSKNSDFPELLGEWWMAGYYDHESCEMTFLFFDQGVGIPTTIRQRRHQSLSQRLAWPDHLAIEEAVMVGVSRRDSERHGNGLPSLKEVIDQLDGEGYLRVISVNGEFQYNKQKDSVAKELDIPLNGSLVVWSIRLPGEDMAPTKLH